MGMHRQSIPRKGRRRQQKPIALLALSLMNSVQLIQPRLLDCEKHVNGWKPRRTFRLSVQNIEWPDAVVRDLVIPSRQ